MNPPPNSNRVSKLKKRFLDILSGSVKLDPRGASLFLEGLCVQDDPVGCLNTITDSTHGLSSVQSAMWFDLSTEFMNGLGSTVLQYLLQAGDVGGDALDDLLFHVVEPPIFWDAFVRAFQQSTLSEDAQLVFAKLLSRLVTLKNQDTTPYRAIASQPFIQESLIASSKHEIREIGHLIKHMLSNVAPGASSCVLDGPGGRHDNDFADYHDIAILPTVDEILCRKPPFLRASFHDELNLSETPDEDYLDNTFRMLREDMLFDIREEVEAALQTKKKHRGPHVIANISMIGIYTDQRSRWGVQLQCSEDFKQLKNIAEEADRIEFLKRDRGMKIVRHQSLICLASGQDIISFGTVNRVEELLARKPPVIVLQLDGAVNTRRTLTALSTSKNLRLLQVDASTFAFEPVLTALQKTVSVPLIREILLWNEETPIGTPQKRAALSHIANIVSSNLSVDLSSLLHLPMSISLDKSQAKSLITGLTKRVSLIQGPPGTGKSFIGTILAKAIHDKTSLTILIVCYTNHALDQFLGDLERYDIPAKSMIRLGGRASKSVEHLSHRNQPRVQCQYSWDKISKLRRGASGHEAKLRTHFREWSNDQDANLMDYLELEHHEFFQAFHVLPAEDGMTLVGEGGRAVDDKYLFLRWIRGLDAGVLSGEPHVRASAQIWGMGHSARQQQLATWRRERITKITESMCQAGIAFNESQDAIKQEFGESTVAMLRQKRIIACTTTGAAIYAEAIKAVGPQFLLVEEAGEILESHILTALSRTVDQMILIGDHKQLRPKVNNYQLTVERGEGFDLNRSLFERLVLKGYPHETLSTQHRMRPEISAFVRELTYPELIDAPSTQRRPNIRGVQSDIIFVDHSHPEDDNTLIGDRADGGTKSSKQNSYEVQMVRKIVRYLAQQGYKSEDIVVLTPYLGQLYQLRDALKHDNDLILNDMDSLDLARAGVPPSEPSSGRKGKKDQIYLATIDNYQGEESDIVIASLTRSNKSNMIGFMDSPERLNVLLSRARNGLILIGNSQTFLHSKKGGALWRRFFDLVEKGRFVYQGFPVKCERHPERLVLLARASDFGEHCPDGGCTEPCGFILACGHACSMKCHPHRSSGQLNPHATSQCRHKMSAMCPAGHHRINWECRLGRPSACSACVKEAKRLEEIAQQERERRREQAEAEAEHHRRMAELEAELEAERAAEQRRLQEEREARTREEQRRQKEEEERKQEEENERRRQEREMYRRQEEMKREREREEERRKQEREEEQRRQEGEARRRQEEEKRRREEENERLRQDSLRRIQQRAEEREEERRRQEQLLAAALANRRQERLTAERQQKDEVVASALARVQEYTAERERALAAKNSETSRCIVQ